MARVSCRELILDALQDETTFMGAQPLYMKIRQMSAKNIGLTTVYRHLSQMTDEGLLDMIISPTGEAMYRRCETHAHHHHLVCTECGAVSEIEAPDFDEWIEREAEAREFVPTSHAATVFGLCREDSERLRNEQPPHADA